MTDLPLADPDFRELVRLVRDQPNLDASRKHLDDKIERLIALRDALDEDPDAEPSLGSPEADLRVIPGRGHQDQREWAKGGGGDLEADDSDREDDDECGEPASR